MTAREHHFKAVLYSLAAAATPAFLLRNEPVLMFFQTAALLLGALLHYWLGWRKQKNSPGQPQG